MNADITVLQLQVPIQKWCNVNIMWLVQECIIRALSERVSDCRLTSSEKFSSYIMWWKQFLIAFGWNDVQALSDNSPQVDI